MGCCLASPELPVGVAAFPRETELDANRESRSPQAMRANWNGHRPRPGNGGMVMVPPWRAEGA